MTMAETNTPYPQAIPSEFNPHESDFNKLDFHKVDMDHLRADIGS